jgi:hypothetical protein
MVRESALLLSPDRCFTQGVHPANGENPHAACDGAWGSPLRVCRQPPSALSPDAYRKRADQPPGYASAGVDSGESEVSLFNTWTRSSRTTPDAAGSRSRPAKLHRVPCSPGVAHPAVRRLIRAPALAAAACEELARTAHLSPRRTGCSRRAGHRVLASGRSKGRYAGGRSPRQASVSPDRRRRTPRHPSAVGARPNCGAPQASLRPSACTPSIAPGRRHH